MVIADSDAVLDHRGLRQYARAAGARLLLAPVAAAGATARHDAGKLSAAVAAALELPVREQPTPGQPTPEQPEVGLAELELSVSNEASSTTGKEQPGDAG